MSRVSPGIGTEKRGQMYDCEINRSGFDRVNRRPAKKAKCPYDHFAHVRIIIQTTGSIYGYGRQGGKNPGSWVPQVAALYAVTDRDRILVQVTGERRVATFTFAPETLQHL
ncbi:hypothetical protein MPLA_140210 [Mesorhizobium sp. ORS 3359]|nr:hypothetical protein MPLA_140210 [Mesorhizobium sp. ORS 3359]